MVDLDAGAVGGAATAGLVGAALEKPTGHAGEPQHLCSDCGAEVQGRFCHACGQPVHIHRTLLHLGEELLHGVMHFDGRIWRTVPMLFFRPGTLTRNWVHGKRTRYVSPLAMFLFTVFLMFMALSFMPHNEREAIGLAQAQTIAAEDLAKERGQLAEALRDLAAAATAADRTEAEEDVAKERKDVAEAEEDVAGLRQLAQMGIADGDWQTVKRALENRDKAGATAKTAGSAKVGAPPAVRSNSLNFNTGNKKLDEKISKKFENPELAIYKLQQTFYKFSFLLVPFSIPFVAALFLWRRGTTLYDHGVFVLYSLTFVSMLIMLAASLMRVNAAIGGVAIAAVPFLIPTHMFFQLKGAYQLSGFSALWRTIFLLIFCNIALLLFVLAVIWLGFA